MGTTAVALPARRADRIHLLAAPAWAIAAGALAAAVPLLVAAGWAADAGFVSPTHASLVARALAQRGDALDVVGAPRPPVATALGALAGSPWVLSVLACLASGLLVVLLWGDLARAALPVWQQAVLAAGAGLLPLVAYVATERIDDVLLLVVFVLACRGYVRFLGGDTAGGFAAGLWLGVGIAVEVRAALFALPLAALAPVYARTDPGASAAERRRARLSAAVVVGFPALTALAGLGVLAVLGDSDAWQSLVGSTSDLRAGADPGLGRALRETAVDVGLLPVFVVGAVIAFGRGGWRRVLPFAVPVAVIAVARAVGLAFDQPLAIATLIVVVSTCLPSRLSRGAGWALVAAAVLQLALGWATTSRVPFVEDWRTAVIHPGTHVAGAEAAVAEVLADRPTGSTLADPPPGLLARMGTARPLVVPGDERFGRLLVDPSTVDGVLVTDEPGDEVAAVVGDRVPEGFDIVLRWPGGRLMAQAGAGDDGEEAG